MTFPRHDWKIFLLLSAVLATRGLAGEPILGPKIDDAAPAKAIMCFDDLKRLCPPELEQLFARSPVGPQPVGFVRGEIMHPANTSLPCWKAQMANKVWKGKQFCESGDFVNQWKHFQAIRSHVQYGPSYFDGRPCMVLEYDPKTPLFGNMRDEVREVAPGLYLAMVFDRCGCHTFRGFIALELQCNCCGK